MRHSFLATSAALLVCLAGLAVAQQSSQDSGSPAKQAVKKAAAKKTDMNQIRRRPSDIVFIMIENVDCDDCVQPELQAMYDALRKLDKNHDGKIDIEEVRKVSRDLVAHRIEGLIQRLDKDKDGKIGRDEAKGELRRHFDEIDQNKDGYLTRQELLRAATEPEPGDKGSRTSRDGNSDRR